MGHLTERGGFTKSDPSEPADVTVYNNNIDRIHNEAMQIPYVTPLPDANNTWPGKLGIQRNTDPTFFLPQFRYAVDPTFWRIGNVGTWLAYTPETNGTVGNGSVRGRYTYVGTILFIEVLFILGSTSVIASGTSFSSPPGFRPRLPAETNALKSVLGYWMARVGAGPTLYKGRVLRRNTSGTLDMEPRTQDNPALVINATRPDTWANGNKIFCQIMYEAERI